MSSGELIIYTTEDGLTKIQMRAINGSLWLTQVEIADLFQTTPQNINKHVKAIYQDNELTPGATSNYYSLVQTEGDRNIARNLKHYNLEMILAIGYRVRSTRGVAFRQWATANLNEYLIKGFIMDDERLKEPGGGWDYFDELLARIREIRASEKRFYQKVTDLYALSTDYQSNSEQAKLFFKTVQNKMLYAVTGQTAAELIAARANPTQPNMGLKAWKGSKVRKQDILISKNYLGKEELEDLSRVVTMFLDYAENQTRLRQAIYMKDWESKTDEFLRFNRFNNREVLSHAGKVSHEHAEKLVYERYEIFDENRKQYDLAQAETHAIEELQQIVAELSEA